MKRFAVIILFCVCSLYATAQNVNVRSDSKVVVGGVYYYVHTVKAGETLASLSDVYNVGQERIVQDNPNAVEGISEGMVIKIPVAEEKIRSDQENLLGRRINSRRVTTHVVNQGETAYGISKRYAVSIDDIITANPGFDPLNIRPGQQILIPKSSIGSVTQTEARDNFKQYTETVSELSPDFDFVLVEKEEPLSVISRETGINLDTLKKYNETVLDEGLKVGSLLKVPSPDENVAENAQADTRLLYGSGGPRRTAGQFELGGRDFFSQAPATKQFNLSRPLNVAVMMPFTDRGRERRNFIEFYNGTLLALEDLKREGVSLNVNVFDTKRSVHEVESFLHNPAVQDADIIIGPVYEDEFAPVSRFAEEKGIPAVSPLGTLSGGNYFTYQISPSPVSRYEKLAELFRGDKNIIVVTSADMDRSFRDDIISMLPEGGWQEVESSTRRERNTFTGLLSTEKENVIIIPTNNQNTADGLLVQLSSIQQSVASRTLRSHDITVIGNSGWRRFEDKKLFFALQVTYVASYHADRNDSQVNGFVKRYIETFLEVPNMTDSYAFRGYDVMKLFVSAVNSYGEKYPEYLSRTDRSMLQVPYNFDRDESGKWTNNEWVVVKYNKDYTFGVR